jgi:hypothetical protein
MEQFDAHLEKVALFVIEDWAMMLSEIVPAPMFEASRSFYIAEMNFKGEQGEVGTIALLAQLPFMDALARNLLGLDSDDEVDEAQAMDGLREMANVVTGHFVTEAYGVDEAFELLSPGVKPADDDDVSSFLDGHPLTVTGDDEPVSFTYKLPQKTE